MFVNKRVVLEQMEFNSAPNTTGASAPAPNQPQVAQQPAQLPFPFDSNAINPQAFIAFMQSLSVQSTPGASPSSGTFSQTATGNTVTQSLLVPAAPAPKAGTTEKAFTGSLLHPPLPRLFLITVIIRLGICDCVCQQCPGPWLQESRRRRRSQVLVSRR